MLSLLTGWMFLITPVCADDLWYLADSTGCSGSWEYFVSTVRTCLDHWTFDTGRLSNMAVAPFLSLLPRWVFALTSAVAVLLVLVAGEKLSHAPWISGRAAMWILAVSFLFPWFEFLFTIIYASNYVWASAFLLVWLCLFVTDRRRISTPLLLLLSVITGWWHEGMSVPLLCASVIYLLVMRCLPSRRQGVMLAGLCIGIVVIMLMPAFGAMSQAREANLVKSVWIETLINIVAFNIAFYLYAVALLIAMSFKRIRLRLTADRHNLALCVGIFAFGIVSTAIYLRYFNGARTGAFSQLLCTIGLIRLWGMFLRPSSQSIIGGRCLFAVALTVSAVSLISAITVQTRLTREYEEVTSLVKAAEARNQNHVFYDPTPISVGIDAMKPTYMLLNTAYGLRGMDIIPSELETFEYASSETVVCRDSRLVIYHNRLVCRVPIPDRRVDITIYRPDSTSVTSRLRHRPFVTSRGDSCIAIIPHIQQFGTRMTIADAEFVDF